MIVSLPSRVQLINWVNMLTNGSIVKLQSLSDGVHFCQMFDKIYPRRISLNRLKRDAKIPLEKQRNFRLLLNAINDLGLLVCINIADLSEGKVTSILPLLLWFYKQYKSPSVKQRNEHQVDCGTGEPHMIKSYVGNLISRQVSCQKQGARSQWFIQNKANGRSLDAKPSKKTFLQADADQSICGKSQQKSKVRRLTKSKLRGSTARKQKCNRKSTVLSVDKQAFQVACQEQRKSLKEIKQQRKQQTFQDYLSKRLDCEDVKLRKTFIRVTEEILRSNPQLEQKLREVIGQQNQNYPQGKNQQKSLRKNLAPDINEGNVLSSVLDSSQICLDDTLQQVQIDRKSTFAENSFLKNDPNLQILQKQNSLMHSNTEKKQRTEDRKDTVKKSSIKSGKEKLQNPHLIPQQIIKQISAQKVQIKLLNGDKKQLKGVQQRPQNYKEKLSRKFCPHQKVVNPEQILSQLKVQPYEQSGIAKKFRVAYSQNLSVNLNKNSEDVWRPNQNLAQGSNFHI